MKTKIHTSKRLRHLFQSPFQWDEWQAFWEPIFDGHFCWEKMPVENDDSEQAYLGHGMTSDGVRLSWKITTTAGNTAVETATGTTAKAATGTMTAETAEGATAKHGGWKLSLLGWDCQQRTYVFGCEDFSYEKAVNRFCTLIPSKAAVSSKVSTSSKAAVASKVSDSSKAAVSSKASLEDWISVFSADVLANEFFDDYMELYASFVEEATDKICNESCDEGCHENCDERQRHKRHKRQNNEKQLSRHICVYVKSMMGRLLFLYFLQNEGWLNGDRHFLRHLLEASSSSHDFLMQVFDPSCFGLLPHSLWQSLSHSLWQQKPLERMNFLLSKDGFYRLLDCFDRYTFTLQEPTAEESEVAISPEMLGKIFESLLENNKHTGTFYTPREVVSYMCRESLVAYLVARTPVEETVIRKLMKVPQTDLSHQASLSQQVTELLSESQCRCLQQALADIRIFDPAIGSGAFPLGMLQELVRLRELVGKNLNSGARSRTELKKEILAQNLFGVDIEQGAVDIARLRLWLSLLASGEVPSTRYNAPDTCNNIPDTRYNAPVFPSLVCQLKRGDALQISKQSCFDLVIGNPPYIGEKGHKEIFLPLKTDKMLGTYYMGKMDYFYFFFHLAFNLLTPGGICSFITTNYYPTAMGARKLRTDIKERMQIRLLLNLGELRLFEHARGQHSLISLLSKNHGETQERCRVLDVHLKGTWNPSLFAAIVRGNEAHTTYAERLQAELFDGEENYIRLSHHKNDEVLASVLNKMQVGNATLGEIAEVNAGIMGGCDCITPHNLKYASAAYLRRLDIRPNDGVFVLDACRPRDAATLHHLEHDVLSPEVFPHLIKPFYKNSDIRRYGTNVSTSKRLIYSAIDTPEEEQRILQSCLDRYRPILTRIREINHEKTEYWHRLRRGTAHPQIFVGPKIVCPQRCIVQTFGYNECDWYASADVYYITHPREDYPLKYLLALLNSKLFFVWLYHKGKRKGDLLELYQKPLSEIPIRKPSTPVLQRILQLVEERRALLEPKEEEGKPEKEEGEPKEEEGSSKEALRAKAIEAELDKVIYRLYQLTDEEISFVESLS